MIAIIMCGKFQLVIKLQLWLRIDYVRAEPRNQLVNEMSESDF